MHRFLTIGFVSLLSFFVVAFLSPTFAKSDLAFAQTPPAQIPHDTFMNATVIKLSQSNQKGTDGTSALQNLEVKVTDGTEANKTITLSYDPSSNPGLTIQPGDNVVIAKVAKATGTNQYYFVDQKRTFPVALVLIGFIGLIFLIAGRKGIGAVLGSGISLGVIFVYIVPQIINGADPLTTCLIGSVIILFVTTYVAHGMSKQTTIALLSTLLALFITYFLAQLVANITLLNGYGNEQAAELRYGLKNLINIKGLMLGGIILTTLGALNDITITQAAAIFSLHKHNEHLHFKTLAKEGFSIGREHAISLVNTLILAYAGGSLAVFIFFLYNPNQQPWWVILNSEFLNEEVMKTIAGTSGLLLSVPFATFLAALVCDRRFGEFFVKLKNDYLK